MALILVTRPQPDADTTAAKLQTRGHEVLVAPLLSLEAMDVDLPKEPPWAAVLVTSANAVRALPERHLTALARLPLLAVGRRTAEAAREAGFSEVQSADGDMQDLSRLVAARFPASGKPLLYLAGAERSGDLASALAKAWITVETKVVYRMAARSTLPLPVCAALAARRIAGVLHFSQRSAETYRACALAGDLEESALSTVQYCLSEGMAAVFRGTGAIVRVAPRPEEDVLLDLIPR
jgi:uroporphyrinogen-III synthase